MARRRKQQPPAARVGRAVTKVATIGRRLDERVRPWATAVGWIGVAALLVCALLAVLPSAAWPAGLARDRLPVWATLSLVAASLLGWSFMQEGQARIERRTGRRWALVLFVFLPIAATFVTFVEQHGAPDAATRAEWSGTFWLARWYSPAAIVASLASFLASKPRRGNRRAAYALLLLPYAVLVATLLFGFRFPWLDEPLRRTLGSLGAGAVALQLILAWFVGSSG
jgi:hypothetical protein